MAHTKAKGTTKLGRESESKRLGIKKSDGEKVSAGEVIIKQRGTKYRPGTNVRRGGDDTLYAARGGVVKFKRMRKISFDRKKRTASVVFVVAA